MARDHKGAIMANGDHLKALLRSFADGDDRHFFCVAVLCKSGVVYVSEPDWGAFALVPEENAPGVEPLASMRLCGG